MRLCEVPRGSRRFQKVPGDSKRFPEKAGGSPRFNEVTRGPLKFHKTRGGSFIMLSHWEIRRPSTWPDTPTQSHYLDIKPTSSCPLLVMLTTWQ